MAKLTQKQVDALRPGDRRIVWDGEGLGVRITEGALAWICDYVDPETQKRARKVIGEVSGNGRLLLAEARVEAAKRRASRHSADFAAPAAPKPKAMTFQECWDSLLSTARLSLSPATIRSYEQRVVPVLAELGGKAVGTITEDDVRRTIFSVKGERSRTYAHTLIRMTVNWAIRNKKLRADHHNPAAAIRKRELLDKNKIAPDREIPEPDLVAFGEELSRWESAGKVSPWLAGLFRLSLLSALRPGEARTLTWADVDLKAGFMIVRGKTGARRIYLSPEARKVLEGLPRIDGVDWCFPGRKFGEPIQAVHKMLHLIQDAAGIARFRPYDFRHTSATGALVGGSDLRAVQALLGHADIATTSKYLHASEDRKRQAAVTAGRKGAVILSLSEKRTLAK